MLAVGNETKKITGLHIEASGTVLDGVLIENKPDPKINENEFTTYPYSVTLEDYHQLSSVSSNDRKILQICQQGSDGFR